MCQKMNEQKANKDTKDYCSKDYKNKHRFERIGVTNEGSLDYILFQCTQCKKCIFEEVKYLED